MLDMPALDLLGGSLAEARSPVEVVALWTSGREPQGNGPNAVQQMASQLRYWGEMRVIGRTFGETRTHVKAIGRLLGVPSCVSHISAVLERGVG